MRSSEATEVKGAAISTPAAIADRLEAAIARIEANLARHEQDNARLRRIESAASAALADLDAFIADQSTQRKYG